MKISQKDYYHIPLEQRNRMYEIEDWGTFYWVNGKRHREDGPAYQSIDGYKSYYINGKLHRLDGPAAEWDGDGDKYYYIENNRYLVKEEFEAAAYLYNNGLQDYL